MGVGIGEAGLNPAAFSLLSDYFSKERLGSAVSVFYIGQVLGSSLALAVGGTVVQLVTRQPEATVPILGTIASWRLTFLILGLPGLLLALLAFTVREPVRKNLARSAAGGTRLSMAESIDEIGRRWQSVLGVSLGFAFLAACVYGFSAWVPTYVKVSRSYGQRSLVHTKRTPRPAQFPAGSLSTVVALGPPAVE
jgi:MFS family permease